MNLNFHVISLSPLKHFYIFFVIAKYYSSFDYSIFYLYSYCIVYAAGYSTLLLLLFIPVNTLIFLMIYFLICVYLNIILSLIYFAFVIYSPYIVFDLNIVNVTFTISSDLASIKLTCSMTIVILEIYYSTERLPWFLFLHLYISKVISL